MLKHRFAPTEPVVYLKAVALGFVLVQLAAFGFHLGRQVSSAFPEHPYWLALASTVTLLMHIAYAYSRKFGTDSLRVLGSRRFDLGLLALFGVACGVTILKLVRPAFVRILEHVDPSVWMLLWLSTVVGPTAYFARFFGWRSLQPDRPHFLDDKEIVSAEEDALGIADRAARFAEQVASTDSSVIFGVDAPWGTGKTSFINLCAVHWRSSGRLVYRFEPLRYTEDSNLVERFLSDLIAEIQKHHFIPELRPALAR
jgi:hypothetical protein